MLGKLLTSVAFLSVGLFNFVAAAPTGVSPGKLHTLHLVTKHAHCFIALAIPTSGKYRIQNAATGFFIDDLNSNQGGCAC